MADPSGEDVVFKVSADVQAILAAFTRVEDLLGLQVLAFQRFAAAADTAFATLQKGVEESAKSVTRSASTTQRDLTLAATAGVFFGNLAEKAFEKVGAAMVDTVKAIPDLVDGIAHVGDRFWEMSAQTGVAVEALSKFDYVATQTGTSVESITTTIFMMQRRLGEGSEQVAASLSRLGLSMSELRQAKPEDAFLRIIEGLHGVQNASERSSIGWNLFGRQFRSISQLAQTDMDGLMKKAEEMGLVITQAQANLSDAYTDAVDDFNRSFQGLKQQIGFALMPAFTSAFEQIAQAFQNFSKNIGFNPEEWGARAKRTADLIVRAFTDVAAVVTPLAQGALSFFEHVLDIVTPFVDKILTVAEFIGESLKNTWEWLPEWVRDLTTDFIALEAAVKLANSAMKLFVGLELAEKAGVLTKILGTGVEAGAAVGLWGLFTGALEKVGATLVRLIPGATELFSILFPAATKITLTAESMLVLNDAALNLTSGLGGLAGVIGTGAAGASAGLVGGLALIGTAAGVAFLRLGVMGESFTSMRDKMTIALGGTQEFDENLKHLHTTINGEIEIVEGLSDALTGLDRALATGTEDIYTYITAHQKMRDIQEMYGIKVLPMVAEELKKLGDIGVQSALDLMRANDEAFKQWAEQNKAYISPATVAALKSINALQIRTAEETAKAQSDLEKKRIEATKQGMAARLALAREETAAQLKQIDLQLAAGKIETPAEADRKRKEVRDTGAANERAIRVQAERQTTAAILQSQHEGILAQIDAEKRGLAAKLAVIAENAAHELAQKQTELSDSVEFEKARTLILTKAAIERSKLLADAIRDGQDKIREAEYGAVQEDIKARTEGVSQQIELLDLMTQKKIEAVNRDFEFDQEEVANQVTIQQGILDAMLDGTQKATAAQIEAQRLRVQSATTAAADMAKAEEAAEKQRTAVLLDAENQRRSIIIAAHKQTVEALIQLDLDAQRASIEATQDGLTKELSLLQLEADEKIRLLKKVQVTEEQIKAAPEVSTTGQATKSDLEKLRADQQAVIDKTRLASTAAINARIEAADRDSYAQRLADQAEFEKARIERTETGLKRQLDTLKVNYDLEYAQLEEKQQRDYENWEYWEERKAALTRKYSDDRARAIISSLPKTQAVLKSELQDLKNTLATMLKHRKDYTNAEIAGVQQEIAAREAEISVYGRVDDALQSTLNILGEIGQFGSDAFKGVIAGLQRMIVATQQAGKAGIALKDAIARGDYAAMAEAAVNVGTSVWKATDQASRGMRALGGAMAGAKAGAAFGPYGIAIGAAAGLIVGLVRGKPAWAKAADEVGKDFGVKISEALARTIADDAKKLFKGDRQAATLYNLKKIIDEAGGLSSKNVDKFAHSLSDMFSMFDTGKFSADQLVKSLKETLPAFVALAETDPTAMGTVASSIDLLIDRLHQGTITAVQFTDALGNSLDTLGRLAATNPQAMNAFVAAASSMVQLFKEGKLSADQVTAALDGGLSKLAQTAIKKNAIIGESFIQLARQAKAAGLELQALDDFNEAMITKLAGGMKAAVEELPDAAKISGDLLKTLSADAVKRLKDDYEAAKKAATDAGQEFKTTFEEFVTNQARLAGEHSDAVAKMEAKTKEYHDLQAQLEKATTAEQRAEIQKRLDLVRGELGELEKKAKESDNSLARSYKDAHDRFARNEQEINDLEKRLDDNLSASERARVVERLTALNKEQDALRKVIGSEEEFQKKAAEWQGSFDRLSRIALASFNAMVAAGKSPVEAMDALGESIDKLIERQSSLGLQGNAAFDQLKRFRSLVNDNKALVESVGGLNDVLVALANLGGLDADTFKDLETQGANAFQQLTAAGFTENEALQQMVPFLKSVIKAHKERGLAIDENTKKMIDQADKAGLLAGEEASVQDVLREGISALIEALGGKLPAAWQKAADAAKDAAAQSSTAAQTAASDASDAAAASADASATAAASAAAKSKAMWQSLTPAMQHVLETLGVTAQSSVEDIGAALGMFSKETMVSVAAMFEQAGIKAGDSAEVIKQKLAAIGVDIAALSATSSKTAADASAGAIDTATTAADAAATAATAAQAATNAAASSVTASTTAAAEAAKSSLALWASLTPAMQRFLEQLGITAQSSAADIGAALGIVGKQTELSIAVMFERAGIAAGDSADVIKSKLQAIGIDLTSLSVTGSQTAEQAATAAVDAAATASDEAARHVGEVFNLMTGTWMKLPTETLAVWRELPAELQSIYGAAGVQLGDTAEVIAEKLKAANATTATSISDVWARAGIVAGDSAEIVAQKLQAAMETLWSESAKSADHVDEYFDRVTNTWMKIPRDVAAVAKIAVDETTGASISAIDAAALAAEEAARHAGEFFNQMTGKWEKLPTEATAAWRELPASLRDIYIAAGVELGDTAETIAEKIKQSTAAAATDIGDLWARAGIEAGDSAAVIADKLKKAMASVESESLKGVSHVGEFFDQWTGKWMKLPQDAADAAKAAMDEAQKAAEAAANATGDALATPLESMDLTDDGIRTISRQLDEGEFDWRKWAEKAAASADKATDTLGDTTDALGDIVTGLVNQKDKWERWRDIAIAAIKDVHREIDGLNWGNSPGGIKQIPIELGHATDAADVFARTVTAQMSAVHRAMDAATKAQFTAKVTQTSFGTALAPPLVPPTTPTGQGAGVGTGGDEYHLHVNVQAIDNANMEAAVEKRVYPAFLKLLKTGGRPLTDLTQLLK